MTLALFNDRQAEVTLEDSLFGDLEGDPDGLRWYQREAVDGIHAQLKTVRSTLIVCATGTGKTTIFGAIAKHWPGSVLILAHRNELVQQARRRIEHMTGEWVEVEQAMQTSHSARIVVGSVQSLCKKQRLERLGADRFSLVIVDECFPAGTTVDGKPIETIVEGDMVRSVDHSTGKPVKSRVTRVFRHIAKRGLVRLRLNGATEVGCTPNHPVFVKGKGYVEAKNLVCGDMLCVRQAVRARSSVWTEAGEDVFGGVQVEDLLGDHGSYKPSPCFCEDAEAQPDASFRDQSESVSGAQEHWPCPAGEGRKRQGCDGRRGGDCKCTRLGAACCCADEDAAKLGLPDLLQDGRGERGLEDRRGGGRLEPLGAIPQGSGREEGFVLAWVRLDSVTRVEPASAGGTPVYNLEVEGSHTYFANNILVHNCHHTTAASYRKVIDFFDGAKLLGVTATPDRGDKVALGKVFESTAYVFDIEDGIDHGYLVPVRGHHVTMTEIDLDVVKKTAGDLAANQLDEAMLKAAGGVAQKTMELYPERQAIVFMPGIKSAELACARFNEMRPGCAMFIHANTEDDERAQMVRDFQRGVYQYFVNVGIATEGFDAPNVSLVVIARPTLSRALYAQMAGRGTRVEPGCIDYTEGREMAAARRKLIAASRKPDCVILDFAGNSTKHSLVSTVDILGGKYTDDEVKRAKKKIEKEPGTNPREALERSREELRAIASNMRVKVKAESKAFNPFAVLHMDETAGQKHTQKFGYKAMDPGLRNALLNYGLKEAQLKEMSRYDALRFIAAQRARAKANLCTFKQLVQLQRFGVTEVNVPFDRAKAAMKYIEAKKWGRGDTVDPKKLDAIIHYRREPGDESL